MKNKTYDGMLAALCVFLFLTVGCGVTALCLINNAAILLGFSLKYCFAVLCGAFLVVFLTLSFVCIGAKRVKTVGLSFLVVLVSSVLIALSPLALIMWVIEAIAESIAEKRSNSHKI